ncbi:hypothetical protein M1D88_16935 [Arthrobacter sp. R1-13]
MALAAPPDPRRRPTFIWSRETAPTNEANFLQLSTGGMETGTAIAVRQALWVEPLNNDDKPADEHQKAKHHAESAS